MGARLDHYSAFRQLLDAWLALCAPDRIAAREARKQALAAIIAHLKIEQDEARIRRETSLDLS